MLKELVEHIVKKLVDRPEMVQVSQVVRDGQPILLELRVDAEDLGKVIGKEGRTARSIRTLIHAAATKEQMRAVLEIIE